MTPELIGLIGAGATAVVSAGGALILYAVKIFKLLENQTTPNGGSSLRDSVDRIAEAQDQIRDAVQDSAIRAQEFHKWSREEARRQEYKLDKFFD